MIELAHWYSGDYSSHDDFTILLMYIISIVYTEYNCLCNFCRTASTNNKGKPCYICPDEHCRFLMWESEICSENTVTHTGQRKLTGMHIALIHSRMHVMTHYEI